MYQLQSLTPKDWFNWSEVGPDLPGGILMHFWGREALTSLSQLIIFYNRVMMTLGLGTERNWFVPETPHLGRGLLWSWAWPLPRPHPYLSPHQCLSRTTALTARSCLVFQAVSVPDMTWYIYFPWLCFINCECRFYAKATIDHAPVFQRGCPIT